MTVNEKSGHFSGFGIGLRNILSQLDVELQRQAENDRVEQFRHYIILTCQVSFTGPFPWTSWEGGHLEHFFSHKKHQFLNGLSRILVFPHCPLIKNFHVMGASFFFDYMNTKPGICHTISLNLHKNIEIFGNNVF